MEFGSDYLYEGLDSFVQGEGFDDDFLSIGESALARVPKSGCQLSRGSPSQGLPASPIGAAQERINREIHNN